MQTSVAYCGNTLIHDKPLPSAKSSASCKRASHQLQLLTQPYIAWPTPLANARAKAGTGENKQSIMRCIADTPYRIICVSCGNALIHGKILPHAKQGVSCKRASDQLQVLTQPYIAWPYPLANARAKAGTGEKQTINHTLHCRHTIQKYLCQKCQRTYTSLDVATFPMVDHAFQCEHCSEEGFDVPLRESYQGQDGDLVDAQQRAQRVSQAKQMQVMRSSKLLSAVCALYCNIQATRKTMHMYALSHMVLQCCC